MNAARALAATLSCLAALLTNHPSSAQSSDEWRFQAIAYVYLPSVDGETTFPSSGGAGGASVDASKLLENLNFAFMGSFEASNGRWGMFTDVIYLDFGDSESPSRDISIGGGTLPVGASATIRYDLHGWLWTLAGSWRAASAPNYELNLIGGARLLDIDQNIDWQLSGNIGTVALPDRAGNRKAGVKIGMRSSVSKAGQRSAKSVAGSCLITWTSAPASRRSPGRRQLAWGMRSDGAT